MKIKHACMVSSSIICIDDIRVYFGRSCGGDGPTLTLSSLYMTLRPCSLFKLD